MAGASLPRGAFGDAASQAYPDARTTQMLRDEAQSRDAWALDQWVEASRQARPDAGPGGALRSTEFEL